MKQLLSLCLIVCLATLISGVCSSTTPSTFVTSSCNFTFDNARFYDLSPLTLKDGRSYKASYSFLKLDFLFNVCGYTQECFNQFSANSNNQACTTFPIPVQVGEPTTQTVVENSNGITLSYKGNQFLCERSNDLVFTCDNSTDFQLVDVSIHQCKYTVNIKSRHACPTTLKPVEQCKFSSTNKSPYGYNLAAFSNLNNYYSTPFTANGDRFDLLFSVCGTTVDKCQQYNQLSGNSTAYQSCQVYNNTNSIQTGTPSLLTYEASATGIDLLYKSNSTKQNKISLSCDTSTDFQIMSTNTIQHNESTTYQVNANSKHACPSQCVFNDTRSGRSIDLSGLILPNNGHYTAIMGDLNSGNWLPWDNYFAICGQVDVCKRFREETPNVKYQSCQSIGGSLSIQTGSPTTVNVTISHNRAVLNYTSDAYPCGKSAYRYSILNLICDPTTNFSIVSANEAVRCHYQIDIRTKYACTDDGSDGSSSEPVVNNATCIFRGYDNSTYYDLSPLALANQGSYKAYFPFDGSGFDIYFSICGSKVKVCQDSFNQVSGNSTSYQSCQVYQNKYSVKTGDITALESVITSNGLLLKYTAQAVYYECNRVQEINLTCDPSTEFFITSTTQPGHCIYRVNANTKYACPKRA
ncbi:hypothetical protein CYY_005925 [Polysphondylium violaceum]|uniref:MRH domain-containing protein n=1 Tax=Polysphondylium violaceum TaxID=133409 RepID=A0A8J4PV14_9MYCE|nr:hypothetical protein CYY_005925 [Polysphondylium violaceum]